MIGPIINEFKDYVILRDMPDEKANFIVGIREDSPESAKKAFTRYVNFMEEENEAGRK
ncbi:hypothetical protein QYZ88_015650 [Lachnospiraceae bacterium C1.1]|nr:hypothetical protein [Lachnospiraceae bacterium C1.1]